MDYWKVNIGGNHFLKEFHFIAIYDVQTFDWLFVVKRNLVELI